MRRTSKYREPQRCRGLAIIEFILVAPVCLMLMMATAEFGRAFQQYNTLSKCVRDGVRHLGGKARLGAGGVVVMTPELESETQNVVVYGNAFGTGSPLLPGLTVDDVTVSDDGFNNVTVSASYPYDAIFVFVPAFIYGGNTSAGGYVFQTSITMRAL